MFKLGEVIVWTTPWGTKLMGKINGLFLDNRNVPCLHAICIDDDMSQRGYSFTANVDGCKLFLGIQTKVLELKVCPPLVPDKGT